MRLGTVAISPQRERIVRFLLNVVKVEIIAGWGAVNIVREGNAVGVWKRRCNVGRVDDVASNGYIRCKIDPNVRTFVSQENTTAL